MARDEMLCNFVFALSNSVSISTSSQWRQTHKSSRACLARYRRRRSQRKTAANTSTTSASHIFRIVPHPGIESSPSVRAKRPTTCAAVVDFSFLTPTPSPSPSPSPPQSLSEPELQARQQRVCTAKSASGCHQILLNNTNVAPTTREVAANQ